MKELLGLLFVTLAVLWQLKKQSISLRIIVLGYNRPESLQKCLDMLAEVAFEDDSVALDIWIDRNEANEVNTQVLDVSSAFEWQPGPKEVRVHSVKKGLYGQWMTTWKPADIVLYVEDDVDVSPLAYRWLKHATVAFKDDPRIAGISLQDEYLIIASGRGKGAALRRPSASVFAYPILGPWGFAPRESVWLAFLEWYKEVSVVHGYKPYTENAELYTKWYQDMELASRENTMWTMWFIHYCNIKQLVVVFPNIRYRNKGRINSSLAVHRGEPGLHFGRRVKHSSQPFMVSNWDATFVEFGENLTIVRYDGSYALN